MASNPLFPTSHDLLAPLARRGLLRLGLPAGLGGDGAPVAELQVLAQALWVSDPASALVLRGQRLAIEALRLGRNQALASHLLPPLLEGERAATLPWCLDTPPLRGSDLSLIHI